MKRLSILMIILSALLGMISGLIDCINQTFFELPWAYPTVSLFLKYEDVMMIIGFFGLFLITMKDAFIRWLSLSLSLMFGLRFFAVEFGYITWESVLYLGLSLGIVVMLTFLILRFRCKECPLLSIMGYGCIILLLIHLGFDFVYLFLWSDVPPALIFWSTFVIWAPFRLSVFIFFKGWYKEAFLYRNEMIYTM